MNAGKPKDGQPERLIVESSQPGTRLDAFLRERFPDISRGGWRRLIDEGKVLVNHQATKPTHHPRAGEVIEIHPAEARPVDIGPENIPLEILHEDDWLLVLNKAAGQVVHPAAGHAGGTLVNALLHHCAGSLSGIGGLARPGIVHRLDKETTGCLVVAKNDAAHLALSAQFAAREVQKSYLAIVCGQPKMVSGEIQAAIGRHPTDRKRMAANTPGRSRAAHTSYRMMEVLNHAALMEARIHTGRTHQVRVHFQFLGHPLLGDSVYGARLNRQFTEQTGLTPPRVMLHAASLGFIHPQSGKPARFEAPLPPDFLSMLKKLRTR